MRFKKIVSAMLLCAVLAGCSATAPSHEIPLDKNSDCPISTMRTGTKRQGIKGNGFECTQDGSYFMYDEFGGRSWLLYADRGSDTFIKLCGRPDCNHTDKDCNAFFYDARTICYYDGYLYTLDQNETGNIISFNLIRMNLDGTEKQVVYNTNEFAISNGYKNIVNEKIFNGVLFFMAGKPDEVGDIVFDCGYYKLDGSMGEAKIGNFFSLFAFADGENILVPIFDKEREHYVYYIWDPIKGVIDELFMIDDENAYGYVGTNAYYYVENGVIFEYSYTDGKKELIDTGHTGDYQLACFPDCIVMYEKGPYFEEKILYFYDWNYNDLGNVKIDFEFESMTGFVCGETPERIFLTDNHRHLPRYYINKSDFGTGNIEIHTFNLPEFETK